MLKSNGAFGYHASPRATLNFLTRFNKTAVSAEDLIGILPKACAQSAPWNVVVIPAFFFFTTLLQLIGAIVIIITCSIFFPVSLSNSTFSYLCKNPLKQHVDQTINTDQIRALSACTNKHH